MKILLSTYSIVAIVLAGVFVVCFIALLIMYIFNKKRKSKKNANESIVSSSVLVEEIVSALGGKENISSVEHKMTRLTIEFKEEGKLDLSSLRFKYMLNANKLTLLVGSDASSLAEDIRALF